MEGNDEPHDHDLDPKLSSDVLQQRLMPGTSTPVPRTSAHELMSGGHDVQTYTQNTGTYVPRQQLSSSELRARALQPSAGELQQSTRELPPSAHELQPSAHELKPGTSELQQSARELQPNSHELRINSLGARSVSSGISPPSGSPSIPKPKIWSLVELATNKDSTKSHKIDSTTVHIANNPSIPPCKLFLGQRPGLCQDTIDPYFPYGLPFSDTTRLKTQMTTKESCTEDNISYENEHSDDKTDTIS